MCSRLSKSISWITLFWIAILTLFVPSVASNGLRAKSQDVCQWERFEAACGESEVIIMESATYGRMRLGTCVTENMGHLGCQVNVLDIADAKCSGRRTCTIPVPNADLDKTRPCSELQNYLSASYRCQRVESIAGSVCHTCDYVKVSGSSGHISNLITQESGCGSTECPWLIEVKPGQRIRISLLDFSSAAPPPSPDKTPAQGGAPDVPLDSPVCRVYAVIKDEADSKSVTVCGGIDRNKEVYVSQGNTLQLRMLVKSVQQQAQGYGEFFLLRYEALGCPTLSLAAGMWVQTNQEETQATVGCHDVDVTWKLLCNGTNWLGTIGNCTQQIKETGVANHKSKSIVLHGMSMAIIGGVAVIICTIVVVLGLSCYRLRRLPRNRRPGSGVGIPGGHPVHHGTYQRPDTCIHDPDAHLQLTWPHDCPAGGKGGFQDYHMTISRTPLSGERGTIITGSTMCNEHDVMCGDNGGGGGGRNAYSHIWDQTPAAIENSHRNQQHLNTNTNRNANTKGSPTGGQVVKCDIPSPKIL